MRAFLSTLWEILKNDVVEKQKTTAPVDNSQIWIEFVKAASTVVTAIAAVIGLAIAARGFTTWRSKTIGKRKVELAEDLLADFYRARDIINVARSPGLAMKAAHAKKPIGRVRMIRGQ